LNLNYADDLDHDLVENNITITNSKELIASFILMSSKKTSLIKGIKIAVDARKCHRRKKSNKM